MRPHEPKAYSAYPALNNMATWEAYQCNQPSSVEFQLRLGGCYALKNRNP